VFFFCILATDKQMDSSDALSRSRYREWRLNNQLSVVDNTFGMTPKWNDRRASFFSQW